MNNRSLKGKSVLIGGGAKNLGGLISRTFANDGARICVHYNSASTKKEGQSRSATLTKGNLLPRVSEGPGEGVPGKKRRAP